MKRRFIRHPSDIPIEIFLEDVVTHSREYLNNIGIGGLSFRSRVFLDKDVLIRIRIPLVRPIFEATGRVVWCRKAEDFFNVGVEFMEVDSAFRARMVEQLCHIEHYKKEIREREGRQITGEEAAIEWIRKYASHFPNDLIDHDRA
jgi:hypothetical protein